MESIITVSALVTLYGIILFLGGAYVGGIIVYMLHDTHYTRVGKLWRWIKHQSYVLMVWALFRREKIKRVVYVRR